MTNDSQNYNIAAIRELLFAAFTAESLKHFCQDRPAFQPILKNVSDKPTLNEMVGAVVTSCDKQALLGELLAEVKKVNSRQYERHKPYELPVSGSVVRVIPPTKIPLLPALLGTAFVIVLAVAIVLALKNTGGDEEPPLPSGYKLYDDFSEPQRFYEMWEIDDKNEICEIDAVKRSVGYECINRTSGPLSAKVCPAEQSGESMGVAVYATSELEGGVFQLATTWTDKEGRPMRAYHLDLSSDLVEVITYNLENDPGYMQPGRLNQMDISEGTHLLQIEHAPDRIRFLVDNTEFAFANDAATDLKLGQWCISFYVREGGERISGQFNQVSTLPYRTDHPPAGTSAPTPSTTPTATPSSTLTPTPTNTPSPTPSGEPALPSCYTLYDNFDGPSNDSLWKPLYGNEDVCSMVPQDGALWVECDGRSASNDLKLMLIAADQTPIFHGVAVAAEILNEEDGDPNLSSKDIGRLHLAVTYHDSEGKEIRAYFMRLYLDQVEVTEVDLREGWDEKEPMGSMTVSKSSMHVLQIEYDHDRLRFFVDEKEIPLDQLPVPPTNASWADWKVEGYTFDKGLFKSRVDWTAVWDREKQFCDDFLTGTIDLSRWEISEGGAEYISAKEGHLHIDVPLNGSTNWAVYPLVQAQLQTPSVSRITYTFRLHELDEYDGGWLFLATDCNPAHEAMWIHVGGRDGESYAKYGMKDEEGKTDEGTRVDFDPVAYNQDHTIDLQWAEGNVQVRVDEQLQDRPILCEGPAGYVNFGVVLAPNTRVSGYIDDVSIWP